MNKALAPKGFIYLIVSYGTYKVWRLVPINLLQKKYNIYPAKPPSILQRYVTQPITRLWNRARKLFRKPAKVVYIK